MNLNLEDIIMNKSFNSKEEAINFVGSHMYNSGYVTYPYINTMIERDRLASTYIGNGVAIPHGTDEARKHVIKSSVVVVQIPNGLIYNDGIAYVLFGIAGKENEHMEILSNIALICSDEDNVKHISQATTKDEILKILSGEQRSYD